MLNKWSGKALSIAIVIILIVVGVGIKIFWFPVHTSLKSINSTYEIIDKTLDSNNILANYEWFKRQEEGIQALYKKEARAKEEIAAFEEAYPDKDKWSKFDKDEYARLRSNLTGVSNILDEAIAEYNARSSMANRAIFKENLPVNISRAFYTGLDLIDGGE
jgi:regulatory protein YycI of two-component signal transduction system YycFG